MHSTAFWCLIVVYCFFFFFALLRNHCYSFYERRSNTAVARLVFKQSGVVLPPCRTQFINYKYVRIHLKFR